MIPFRSTIIRWDGYAWAVGIGADGGLTLRVGRADDPRFADEPETRPTCAPHLYARPQCPALLTETDDPFRVRIGRVLAQSRLVGIVLDNYPTGITWYAPKRAADGAIHAVVAGSTVALLLGIATTASEKRLARARGLVVS